MADEATTVLIQTDTGAPLLAVPYYTEGVWAATPSPNNGGRFNVTHTPTGLAILLGVRREDCHVAVLIAARVWGARFDEEGRRSTVSRALRASFEEQLRRARVEAEDPRGPFGDGRT